MASPPNLAPPPRRSSRFQRTHERCCPPQPDAARGLDSSGRRRPPSDFHGRRAAPSRTSSVADARSVPDGSGSPDHRQVVRGALPPLYVQKAHQGPFAFRSPRPASSGRPGSGAGGFLQALQRRRVHCSTIAWSRSHRTCGSRCRRTPRGDQHVELETPRAADQYPLFETARDSDAASWRSSSRPVGQRKPRTATIIESAERWLFGR